MISHKQITRGYFNFGSKAKLSGGFHRELREPGVSYALPR